MNTHLRICALVLILCTAPCAFTMEQPATGASKDIIHGWAACQGWRDYMEDRAVVHEYPDGSVAALVCDGHGGKDVAEYAIVRIPQLLLAKLNSAPDKNEESIKQLLISSFEECDKEIGEKSKWARKGATAALAYVREGKVYMAHAGDSRIFLVKQADGSVIQTDDHRPMAPREMTRLCKTKASISDSRLYGTLAVSRALGDFYLKERDTRALIATPEIFSDVFGTGDTLAIVSDGVTDALKSRHVSHAIRSWTREKSWMDQEGNLKERVIPKVERDTAENVMESANSERARQLAVYLVNKAIFKNSSDNITALVLHHTGGYSCPVVHYESDAQTSDEEFHQDEYWDEDDSNTWY